MKKIILSLTVLLLAATAGKAQCDKNVTYHSQKQELLGTDSNVVETKTDILTIDFTKEKITVNVGEQAGALTGTIKETICQWKEMYKEGKAVYKVDFSKPDGDTSEGAMTVEAKEGNLYLLVELAKLDGKKIKILVSRYEEK
jgi:hypothetical protein